VTDNNIASIQDAHAGPSGAVVDRPSSSVSAFVADAIVEQRRIDGHMQLLADMAAVGDDAIDVGPTAGEADALPV